MSRAIGYLVGWAVAAAILAGCGSGADDAQRLALVALATPSPQLRTPAISNPGAGCDLTASLRPARTLPAPSALPAHSFMAAIQRRGYLRVGVNAAFLHFAFLNPFDGQIQGFEIDLAQRLADAIFGHRPNDLVLEALTVPQRIPFVQQGKVDIVVDAVTITCTLRRKVAFSTVYYDAGQRVLVPNTSPARGLQDLGGKRVCATAGSVPLGVISRYGSHPFPVGEPQAIDCLVALQRGKVDAISTDDAILLGFKAQDPYTKLVGPRLADAPYGMAISRSHPEFVRFVNGVLAQMRSDGSWRAMYHRWLGTFGGATPAPPQPNYDG